MSVIFARSPLRIPLVGGGLIFPPTFKSSADFSSRVRYDKYVYMLVHTVFQQRFRMKYSEIEEVDKIEEIRQPILRGDAPSTLARQPAWDRLGCRRAGRNGHGLFLVHMLSAY